uniref:Ig-like domain-containing protein n=1 Tax=Chelonoidis abingdonii TaxID=106734 RepID=A0A8C0H6V1_CHEAB
MYPSLPLSQGPETTILPTSHPGSLPKPSISISSGGVIPGGGNVTIRCGNYLTYTDPASSGAEFPITSTRQEHGGSYICHYSNRTGETAYSEPSDPVQIIVASKPSISLSPTGVTALGADATIRCQGQRRDGRFFLHKAGDLNPQRHMDPAGARAEFHIPTMGQQHGGNYSCSYQSRSEPFISSQPSNPVELVVAGEGPSSTSPLPALHPAGRVVALGGSVTIRCEGLYPGMEFILRKAGHPNLQVRTAGDWTVAEFPIPSVGREDGGSYICDYRSITDQSRWSYLSDPVEIIAAGEGPGSLSQLPASNPARSSGDFSNANIARLALAAAVLLVLGLILAEAYQSRPRGAPWLR